MDSNQAQDARPTAFTFPDDGRRPIIQKYAKTLKFRPNDKICIRAVEGAPRKGPYIVSSVDGGCYKLQDAQGLYVENGKMFDEEDLELYDEFE